MHPIVHHRAALGWSRAKLATELAIDPETIRRWEAGALPEPEEMAKLARAFGTGALDLAMDIELWLNRPGATAQGPLSRV
jgi:ribosome-binding protein aMBF1 (putative translation factor)